jgi:hypothetical protein
MRIGTHARLHGHHGSCLADGAIGAGDVLHARRHSRLSWVWAWAAHTRVRMRHALGVHAAIVWIAGCHHLAGSSVRAVASQWREGIRET